MSRPIAGTRHANKALVVGKEHVMVRGYPELGDPIKGAITRVLSEIGLAPTFTGPAQATLMVPRIVSTGDRQHNMAELLGRCIRPVKRKAVALARLESGSLVRAYSDRLDPDELCQRGRDFADLVEARRDAVLHHLLQYETRYVADDEIDRTLDLMRSLSENRGYFQRRVGEVASFLPCNQPLYALACFGLVPSLMSSKVHVRPPRAMGSFFDSLVNVAGVSEHFGNLSLSRLGRAEFIAERSRVSTDNLGRRVPVTDAVIFTGASDHAEIVRKQFDRNVLFIVNGAGHNPLVVTESADVERAVASAVRVQLYNQGQDCASPSSILVHRDRHHEFLDQLRAALSKVRVGPYADTRVTVGPITRRHHLKRIQSVLVDNADWLDREASGVIRTGSAIVEPTIIAKPLADGGNFTEHYAPIFFVQRYDHDAELSRYFEDPRYALHAMYVTVFGASRYVDELIDRPFAGRALHDSSTILRDTDLHAPGVERGTQPYGGFGFGASSVSLGGVSTAKPTLPQRDLFELLVRPSLQDSPGPDRARPVPTRPPLGARRTRSLADLERKFFDAAIAPVYSDHEAGNTRVEPLIDGASYLGAVHDAMRSTVGSGDAIYLLAYQLDPSWNVTGDPDGVPLGQLLAAKAASGVEVRIVLNGTPSPLNPWRENRAVAKQLRSWRVDATRDAPLADCVLVDSAGARFTGSHHQKLALVRTGADVTAFVSGMDLVRDHWDQAPHAAPGGKSWPDGSPWGWHDIGIRVTGDAVRGIWSNFRARWSEALRSPRLPFRKARVVATTPPLCPPITPTVSRQSVQILRSAYGWKSGPVRELYLAMKKAIAAAQTYIYIEDQFLCDHGAELFGVGLPAAVVRIPPEYSLFGDIADRLRARPSLKVILVSSGKSDPIDFAPGLRNRRLTPSLRRLMSRLPASLRGQVAVWRVEDVTVHSKLVLIDDEYAAIGSANFRSRSFFGLDDELQVGFVAADGSVRRLRTAIWGELLEIEPARSGSLEPLDRALGYWHPGWANGEDPPAPAIAANRLALVTA